LVLEERIPVCSSRGYTRQIQRHTSKQGRAVSFGRSLQSVPFQPLQYKIVDRIAHPGRISDLRQAGTNRRNERPMLLPLRSLLNPLGEKRNLTIRKRRPPERHAQLLIRRCDPADHETLRGITRNNGETTVAEILLGRVFDVEVKDRGAVRLVWTMAGEAFVGK